MGGMLILEPNILRDSILVRMEMIQYECYVHVNATMWRVVYRELRALTNDKSMALNPMDVNDIYDALWNVGVLLQNEMEVLSIFEVGYRPWPKFKAETETSRAFYAIHDRAKQSDLAELRQYESREDLENYIAMLKKVFRLFGKYNVEPEQCTALFFVTEPDVLHNPLLY
jgi:hypothetical protein